MFLLKQFFFGFSSSMKLGTGHNSGPIQILSYKPGSLLDYPTHIWAMTFSFMFQATIYCIWLEKKKLCLNIILRIHVKMKLFAWFELQTIYKNGVCVMSITCDGYWRTISALAIIISTKKIDWMLDDTFPSPTICQVNATIIQGRK